MSKRFSVFMYDKKTNVRSDNLGLYYDKKEAQDAVKKFRAQGLPAYYHEIGGKKKRQTKIRVDKVAKTSNPSSGGKRYQRWLKSKGLSMAPRTFEGEKYDKTGRTVLKHVAEDEATRLRTQGFKARVVKSGNGYNVYQHRKRGQ